MANWDPAACRGGSEPSRLREILVRVLPAQSRSPRSRRGPRRAVVALLVRRAVLGAPSAVAAHAAPAVFRRSRPSPRSWRGGAGLRDGGCGSAMQCWPPHRSELRPAPLTLRSAGLRLLRTLATRPRRAPLGTSSGTPDLENAGSSTGLLSGGVIGVSAATAAVSTRNAISAASADVATTGTVAGAASCQELGSGSNERDCRLAQPVRRFLRAKRQRLR